MAGYVNEHEAASRTMKVLKLVAAIDAEIGRHDPRDVSTVVSRLTERQWVALARGAGVRAPGPETRRLVALHFLKAAEAVEHPSDPFDGLPS
jgi:hypothetical protein